MKILDKTVIILFFLGLIIIALYLAIIPIARNKQFYLNQFAKNQTTEKTGYTDDELSEIAQKIIDYLFEKTPSLQYHVERLNEDVFSEDAIIHMEDVRYLFSLGRRATLIVAIITIAFLSYLIYRFAKLKRFIWRFSLLTWGLIFIFFVILIIWTLIIYNRDHYSSFFEAGFILFHKLIFPNKDKFDLAVTFPFDDKLIIILERKFFEEISKYIGIIFVSQLIVIYNITFIFHRFGSKINNKFKLLFKKR